MDSIILDSVTKTYKFGLKSTKTALNSISLKVKKGTVFGFLGPNGAGKSTTIKILLNFIRPDSGNVLINGAPPDRHLVRKSIGYMPEKPCAYMNMTLRQLLSFKAAVGDMDSKDFEERAQNVLERVGLSDCENRFLKHFSKGMLQRASLALSLIHDPEILILDEPLSGLDPLFRYEVIELLKTLKKEGKTIFFSSHILNDVERICDEIAILDKGEVKYIGQINEVLKSENLENFFVRMLKGND